MKNLKLRYALFGILIGMAGQAAHGEDIDLFLVDRTSAGTPTEPNVLFMLDNTANWDAILMRIGAENAAVTKKDMIHEALYKIIMDPANDTFPLGMSHFNAKGGKIVRALQPVGTDKTTFRRKIYAADPWTANTPKGNFLNGYVLPSLTKWKTPKFDGSAGDTPQHYYKIIGVVDPSLPETTDDSEPDWTLSKDITGAIFIDGNLKYQDMGMIYGSTIQALPKSNNAPYALALHEDYLYYRGDMPLYGKYDTTYDPAAFSTTGAYKSPNAAQTCERNYIVLIGSGGPDSGENTEAFNRLWQLYKDNGVAAKPIPLPLNPNNFQSNWGDEYGGFFYALGDANKVEPNRQTLSIYVVHVLDTKQVITREDGTYDFSSLSLKDRAAQVFLDNIGKKSHGGYIMARTTSDIQGAFRQIKQELKAVDSSFAASTLPVSVNVRGTNLNQVYMGVFRPDGAKKPNWYGNLKMYQIGYNAGTGEVYLADKNGVRADSPTTGFIRPNATSYWTHNPDPAYVGYGPVGDGWWWWGKRGDSDSDGQEDPIDAFDLPDGDVVEKGGASQWLREHPEGRNVYTWSGSGAMIPFYALAESPEKLGLTLADSELAAKILLWVYGDNMSFRWDGEEKVRSQVHGDVLHSRPAAINYNTANENDVVVYYGSNDGVFHAVKGGKTPSTIAGTSVPAGTELWGFVPPEHLTKLKAVYDNIMIDTEHPKAYFVDGTTVAVKYGGKHYVYFSMRRGGNAVYALEVDDLNGVPPKVAWRVTDAELPMLGQTWSDPLIFLAKIGDVKKPVMVIGAGYDTAEDLDVNTGSHNTKGCGVYVLGATDGTLHKFLPTPGVCDSIPGSIATAGSLDPTTRLQNLTIGYATDTGGNVWKLDFTSTNTADWTITHMAKLGGVGASNRKFLYKTDVVVRTAKGYNAVLVGSGDREHPQDTSVVNYFYMLKDYFAGNSGWPLIMDSLSDTAACDATKPGWKFLLSELGEKTVGNSVTLDGIVYFNTHIPKPLEYTDTTCKPNLGEARSYKVNINDCTYTYTTAPGGGFLPSPVPFTVVIDGETVSAVISGTQVSDPRKKKFGHRAHQFWYKPQVDQ